MNDRGKQEDPEQSDITELLRCVAAGRQANEAAYLVLKSQLKDMAQRQMSAADQHSIDASHVVNHVYMELAGNSEISWQDREQFLAYACREIRKYLVDNARKRNTQKRGGKNAISDIAAAAEPIGSSPAPEEEAELKDDLLKLDKVLPSLEKDHPDLASVVYLHFFGGLPFERIGPLLGIDPATAGRRWKKARIILQRDMTHEHPDESDANDE